MKPRRTKSIKLTSRFLRDGRVVAFPTGTSYGLAVDTQQGFALQRLRNLKARPAEKTFTIFLKSSLWDTFLKLNPAEEKILHHCTNRPLTLLVTPGDKLAHLAQDGRIGLRVIDHPLMQALADAVDVPLTATSANVAGEEPCYTPESIEQKFPYTTDNQTYNLSLAAILDAGSLPVTPASTIAQLDGETISIIRPGQILLPELQSASQSQ